MNIIRPDARALLENGIIQSMSVIDWGKAMARANEIIQRDLLRHRNLKAYDPELDADCPKVDHANNSPGFDILLELDDGKLIKIQSKLRQVKGKTDFSHQIHFETTRRHSKKNEGDSSSTGHVAYSPNEFDYVLISLVNIANGLENRNSVDKWSFSFIPVHELVNKEKNCCVTQISAALLKKYQFKIL